MKCFWLLLLLALVTASIAAGQNRNVPDFTLYHDKESLLRLIEGVVSNNPSTMQIEDKHKTEDEYSVTLPLITLEPSGLTTDHSSKIRVMMLFGVHAREIISGEWGLRLLSCFQSETHLRACVPEERDFDLVKRILDNVVFKIFPLVNPVGRELLEDGNACQRKNGRKVDLNRNWAFNYGVNAPSFESSQTHPGHHAFSEPETQIVRDAAHAFEPHVFIDVHSGICAIFMPYDHRESIPRGRAARLQLKMIQTLKSTNLLPECIVGHGGGNVGYLSHGTGSDYMHIILNVPLSATWEIYGDYGSCYVQFNPLTQKALQETVSMWTATFFHFLELMVDHPGIPKVLGDTPAPTSEEAANVTSSTPSPEALVSGTNVTTPTPEESASSPSVESPSLQAPSPTTSD